MEECWSHMHYKSLAVQVWNSPSSNCIVATLSAITFDPPKSNGAIPKTFRLDADFCDSVTREHLWEWKDKFPDLPDIPSQLSMPMSQRLSEKLIPTEKKIHLLASCNTILKVR